MISEFASADVRGPEVICPKKPRADGHAPWVTIWKGEAAFVYRQFATQELAMQAAREVAIGPPIVSEMFVAFPAREPYPSHVGDLIAGAVDLADRALATIFAGAVDEG